MPTCFSTIVSLFCNAALVPSVMFTKFGNNDNVDDEDYSMINLFCCPRRSKKEHNNEGNNGISNDA